MSKLKAYRIFKGEIEETKNFLIATRYAFEKTSFLRTLIKDDKGAKNYLIKKSFDPSPSGVSSFKGRAVEKLNKTLNQQTLVRFISALEVFLVDSLRDIFIITKTPFKDQSKVIKFNQNQLLSTKNINEIFNEIINKECRTLSSSGFNEIIKFYKKKLSIDLLPISPGKQKMVEYHDYRHLIVHKLGRTDSQFRKKYNIKNKLGIHISNKYLDNCIVDIQEFAAETYELIIKKIEELKEEPRKNIEYERKVKYIFTILDQNSDLKFLNPEYEFWVGDELKVLKNILLDKRVISSNTIELSLAGDRRVIKALLTPIRYAAKNKFISYEIIEDLNKNKSPKKARIPIDESTIEAIKNEFPEQPWETGIHKKVAKKLNLTNSFVRNVLQILIKRGIFKHQIKGVLIDPESNNSNEENKNDT